MSEVASERISEWLGTYFPIHGYSEPWCIDPFVLFSSALGIGTSDGEEQNAADFGR